MSAELPDQTVNAFKYLGPAFKKCPTERCDLRRNFELACAFGLSEIKEKQKILLEEQSYITVRISFSRKFLHIEMVLQFELRVVSEFEKSYLACRVR